MFSTYQNTYYIAIDACSVAAGIKSKEYFRMQNKKIQPTDFFDGYEKVGNVGANIQYMHRLKNSGVHAAAPDTVTYKKVIGAYIILSGKEDKEAPLKAEKLLRDMIHLRNKGNPLITPDHRSYNHLIVPWLKDKQQTLAEWSEWWLHRMWEDCIEIRSKH